MHVGTDGDGPLPPRRHRRAVRGRASTRRCRRRCDHRLGHVHVGQSTRSVRPRACSRTACWSSPPSPRSSGWCCSRRSWRATPTGGTTTGRCCASSGRRARARVVDACAPLVPVAVARRVARRPRRLGRRRVGCRSAPRAAPSSRVGCDFDATVLIGGAVVLVAVVLVTSAAARALGRAHACVAARARRPGARDTARDRRRHDDDRREHGHPGRTRPPRDPVALGGRRHRARDGRGDRRRRLLRFAHAAHDRTGAPGLGLGRDRPGFQLRRHARRGRSRGAATGWPPIPTSSAVTEVWIDYQPRVNGHTVPGFARAVRRRATAAS